jgi:glutathione S-transferase
VSALELSQPDPCPLANYLPSVFPWVRVASWAGVPGLERFTHIKAWLERMEAREAVKAGLDVPEPNTFDPNASQEELDAKAKEASKWIMKGQEEKK